MKGIKKVVLLIACVILTMGTVCVWAASEDAEEKIKNGVSIDSVDVSGMTETGTYSLVFKDKTLIDEFNNESATTTITFSKSIISSNTDNYQKVQVGQ